MRFLFPQFDCWLVAAVNACKTFGDISLISCDKIRMRSISLILLSLKCVVISLFSSPLHGTKKSLIATGNRWAVRKCTGCGAVSVLQYPFAILRHRKKCSDYYWAIRSMTRKHWFLIFGKMHQRRQQGDKWHRKKNKLKGSWIGFILFRVHCSLWVFGGIHSLVYFCSFTLSAQTQRKCTVRSKIYLILFY